MRNLYYLSIFLHILSATIWIGGMLFLTLVVAPLLRRADFRHLAGTLLQAAGERFRFWGWICLGTFFVTGLFNASYRLGGLSQLFSSAAWQGGWLKTLAIKFSLFLIIVALSILHDFSIGPRATRLMENDPNSEETLRLRRQATWIGRINLLLALVIVFLGITLVRGVLL